MFADSVTILYRNHATSNVAGYEVTTRYRLSRHPDGFGACPVRRIGAAGDARWKGFAPGEYVLEKRTVQNLKHFTNGVSYYREMLWKVNAAGSADIVSAPADHREMPWTSQNGWSPGEETYQSGANVVTNLLPLETLRIAGKSFPCDVIQIAIEDDYGTTIKKRWTDHASGLDLKKDESFTGYYYDGKTNWSNSSLKTTGIETIKVGDKSFECFVQEENYSNERVFHSRAQFWMSSKVPGHMVRHRDWIKDNGPPEMEFELIEFGFNHDFLAENLRDSARQGVLNEEQFQQQRREEEEREARKVHELAQKTISSLSSTNIHERITASSNVSVWDFSGADKALVIDALKRALNDESLLVRCHAAVGLSHHGEKGLTSRFSK